MGAFESFADFLAMNGYAFYVWLSYGLALLLIIGLFVWSKWQRKSIEQEIGQQQQVRTIRQQQVNSEMKL